MARCDLLSGIRVLDLTTSRAEMAGRVLADLGAEVIKVEPPGGCDARRLPPFDERAGPGGRSLYWAALGLGKLSLELDLDAPAGRAAVIDLARGADILVESYDPGYLDAIGLGYEALSAFNPRLIFVSVSPFGATGPKAHWPASDLTLEAASGRLALQGDRDRPPLPIGYPQASLHAGAQAAADAIIALNERELSGRGQWLDTSMQEVMIWTLMDGTGYPTMTGADPPGTGDDRGAESARRGPAPLYPCKDGYVTVAVAPGQIARLREAIAAAIPGAGDSVAAPASTAAPGPEAAAALDEARAFFLTLTKQDLMRWAWANDIRLAPVNTTLDLVRDPQLESRGFWTRAGEYLHPGPFARLSRTPLAFDAAAPELGADQFRLARLRARPPLRLPEPSPSARDGEAFAGLKVADFSWVAAGPMTAKALADHGATVVRVESGTRPDVIRNLPPFKDGQAGTNRSQWMANLNTSKLGLSLNLATEPGRAIARRLADWADVVVESFTPGTMKRFGLDYETLSRDRPGLIMLSTCLLGQTGPWASYGGYGNHGSAIAGFHAITGWPDRPPIGPAGPYTDVVTPRFAVPVLAAAILERRRSGLGQHIDLSQVESAIHMIEPLILDQTVNGRTAAAGGAGLFNACPNGVYAVTGLQRYIAIAVETEEQWRALKSIAPLSAFEAAAFDDQVARRDVAAELDATIAVWTAVQDGRALEARLVAAGVPASRVLRPSDLYQDGQLQHRGFFVTLEHSEMGAVPYDGLATRFSAKQSMLHSAAPCLGEHNERVLRDLLGMEPDEIAAYAAQGALA